MATPFSIKYLPAGELRAMAPAGEIWSGCEPNRQIYRLPGDSSEVRSYSVQAIGFQSMAGFGCMWNFHPSHTTVHRLFEFHSIFRYRRIRAYTAL